MRALPFTRISLLSLVLVFSGAACSKSGTSKGQASRDAVPVELARVRRADIPRVQRSVGTAVAVDSAQIRSRVDGLIEKVHFTEGQPVAKGDLLLSIDARPFRNALEIARADLAAAEAEALRAEADATRYARLREGDGVSEETNAQYIARRASAQAAVQSKRASVANAELQLSFTEIRAPFDGRTGEALLREGNLVKANDAASTLLTLVSFSRVDVAYALPEVALASLRARMAEGPVRVRATRLSDQRVFEGQLLMTDNAADPATGTFLAKARFDNADGALWPGQFMEVATELDTDRGVLVVPLSAAFNAQQGTVLFVAKDDGSVDLRPVEVLRSTDGLALVRGNIDEGENVVVNGQIRLVQGTRIKPVQPAPESAP